MDSTTPRPRAYSYTRFSTPEQRKGDSLRRQMEKARHYAEAHDLELDTELVLHEAGKSAFRGANATPESKLGEFLGYVAKGTVPKGSYLLVENLDRISRQTARKAARVLESICDAGITVVTLTDNRKYTTEMLDANEDGYLFLGLVIGFIRAHGESRVKSGRIRDLWTKKRRAAAEARTPMTATCPHWLQLNRERKQYEIIAERAEIVKRVYREALRGRGIARIAIDLNRDNVPVFGKALYWRPQYVRRLLCNPAVTGTLIPHESAHTPEGRYRRKPLDPVKGYYPRVISNATYQRVQSLREGASAPLRGRHAAGEVKNVFAGLVRCALCGSSMPLVSKGVKNKKYRYYVCGQARDGAGCRYISVPVRTLEQSFFEHARQLLSTVPTGGKNGDAVDRQIESAEASLDVLNDSIGRLVDTIARTQSAAAEARLRDYEREREGLQTRLSELYARHAAMSGRVVASKIAELERLALAESADIPALNAALRQCLSRIDVDPDEGTATLNWQHGGDNFFVFSFPGALASRRSARRNAAKREGATEA